MTMTDYIEREALLCEIERREALMVGDKLVSVDAMKSFIKNRPSADVTPVVHGKWIEKKDDCIGVLRCECSMCGESWTRIGGDDPEDGEMFYCSNCGAKMDLEVGE